MNTPMKPTKMWAVVERKTGKTRCVNDDEHYVRYWNGLDAPHTYVQVVLVTPVKKQRKK